MPMEVLEGKKVEAIKVHQDWGFTIDLDRHGRDQGAVYEFNISSEQPPYIKIADWKLNNYGMIEYANVRDNIPDIVTTMIRLNAVKDGRDN